MEHEFPWRATPPAQQRAALELYLEGEALCDRGDCSAGARCLKRACHLAWELSSEEWPSWAFTLRAELLDEMLPAPPPVPLLDDAAATAAWQPEYVSAASITEGIAAALLARSVAVVDSGFSETLLHRARKECMRASQSGLLKPARVATASDGPTGEQSPATRSDRIAWVGSDEEQWEAMNMLAEHVDALVYAVCASSGRELAAVRSRERVMVAAYGQGDAFARHSDNHCLRGAGAHCSSRVLSCIVYLSPADWQPGTECGGDGGSLRIYRPPLLAVNEDTQRVPFLADTKMTDEVGEVLVDVAPIAGRLVLFFSDLRCPHEVLPVLKPRRERYSMITWYKHSS